MCANGGTRLGAASTTLGARTFWGNARPGGVSQAEGRGFEPVVRLENPPETGGSLLPVLSGEAPNGRVGTV